MVREFEHIIANITEKEKRKPKETVLNEDNSLFEEFTTVESYPISRLIVLLNYLKDLAIDFPLSPGDVLFESREKSSKSGRIHTQVKVLERILNLPDDIPSVIDEDTLIILNGYGYRSDHCKARLYGRRNTMTLISRQCRYYLFHDLYFDIDLKNAHPSILLFYAKSHDIEAPELERYVNNREEFLAEIVSKSEMTRNEAKTQVLRAINLISDKYLPESLKVLFHEILPIREHLFAANLGKSITELGRYCLTRESFQKRNLAQQKVSLQSHYCTTEESKCLEILREVCLHKGLLDRNATLTKEARNLSFIPFFDGAYVSFPLLESKKQVQSILDDTNNLIAPYIFELKEIRPEWDFIDEKDLKYYEKISEFMEKIPSSKLNKLLEFLEIPEFSLDETELERIFKQIYEDREKQEKIIDTLTEERQETLDDLVNGTHGTFNSFVKKSSERYLYKVRRALLVIFKENRAEELEKAIKESKTHST